MSTYVDPHGKVFDHLDRLVAWRRGERPAPVTLEWDLSNRCPWGCVDCHFAYTHTRGPWTREARLLPMQHDRGGDLADTSAVCRVLREVREAGVQAIVWTGGGEPTVHPDFLYIARKAHELGLQQGLYTLGATLTEFQVAFLREAFAWVVVSLDHVTADVYQREKRAPITGFARACDRVLQLAGGQCVVGASFLLHERNWDQARAMVALARSLRATYTTLRPTIRTSPEAPATPIGDRSWVESAAVDLEQLAGEPDVEVDVARFRQWAAWTTHPYQTCYGIRLNATITPDLRVWICPNRREFADGSCIGDLTKESWAEVWARHPGQWTDLRQCRAMCRLHPVNETLAAVERPRRHGAFI